MWLDDDSTYLEQIKFISAIFGYYFMARAFFYFNCIFYNRLEDHSNNRIQSYRLRDIQSLVMIMTPDYNFNSCPIMCTYLPTYLQECTLCSADPSSTESC